MGPTSAVARLSLGVVALGACALGVAAQPTHASACGGCFCATFTQPIVQTGENIVFSVEDDGSIEAHVQIFYQGPADQFAWVVPTPSLPTISVGTDTLFQQLELATRPRFEITRTQTGSCRTPPECVWEGLSGGGYRDASAASDGAVYGGVDVAFRGNVGPYDAAVLSATDTGALYAWLDAYDYLIPEEARPEIDSYVARGSYFVALRLQKDRATGEIQPIVLQYTSGEPCIPIRLTRIATVDDMPIRAYFLASTGFRSANYTMLTPDLTDDERLFLGSRTYESVVTNAVDDAGGRAFVTDYRGAPPTLALELPSLEDLRATTDLRRFLAELVGRGFAADSQLLAILTRFVPPPDGVDPNLFFSCAINPRCGVYGTYAATVAFSASDLVDALDEGIVTPRAHAQALVERHPKLTRLYTTMSAADMTEDPVFYPTIAARDVSNVHTARVVVECTQDYLIGQAPSTLTLPSGRRVHYPGIVYRGTDETYCRSRGMVVPRTRDAGTCSASARATGRTGGTLALVAAVLGVSLARRRRRSSAS